MPTAAAVRPLDADLEARVMHLLDDYASKRSPTGRWDAQLSLRDHLGIESLSLVSLLVRLGDELGIDATDERFEVAGLTTVGDVLAFACDLAASTRSAPS